MFHGVPAVGQAGPAANTAAASWLLCTLGMRRLRHALLVLSVSAEAPDWANGGLGGAIYFEENVPVLQQPVQAAPDTADGLGDMRVLLEDLGSGSGSGSEFGSGSGPSADSPSPSPPPSPPPSSLSSWKVLTL